MDAHNKQMPSLADNLRLHEPLDKEGGDSGKHVVLPQSGNRVSAPPPPFGSLN